MTCVWDGVMAALTLSELKTILNLDVSDGCFRPRPDVFAQALRDRWCNPSDVVLVGHGVVSPVDPLDSRVDPAGYCVRTPDALFLIVAQLFCLEIVIQFPDQESPVVYRHKNAHRRLRFSCSLDHFTFLG